VLWGIVPFEALDQPPGFGGISSSLADAVMKPRPLAYLLKGSNPLPAKAVVTVGGIDLRFEIDGDIELA
jgi:hypothetical protein